MRIERHPNFKRSYKKRIAKNPRLLKKTEDRIILLKKDPTNPILKDHKLSGAKNSFRAFSITGNFRIVYMRVSENHIILLDIGTHNQVY